MSDEKKPAPGPIPIFWPPEKVAEYANLCLISHGREELTMDFVFAGPHQLGAPVPVLRRIVLSPAHAKRLLGALSDNLSKYEARFGTIIADEPSATPLN